MTRYSIEPRERKYIKGYGFLSFAKSPLALAKNLGSKYGTKLLDSKLLKQAKKSGLEAAKTASKRAIQKTAEATGDLIGNKIANKIAGRREAVTKGPEIEPDIPEEGYIPPERYISPEKRRQIIDELRLIPNSYT